VKVINNLIKKAQKGDEDAYIKLFQYYEADIYRIAYVYVKNKHDALDIVQETAYKSFSKIKTLKNPDFFKTWLIRIAVNSALTFLKKEKKVIRLSMSEVNSVEANVSDLSLSITLRDLIDRLNETEKSVILLKYYFLHTFDEIANILAMPLGTVKTISYRSLNKLRKEIKKEDYI